MAVWELIEEYKQNTNIYHDQTLEIPRKRRKEVWEDVEWDETKQKATIHFSPAIRLVSLLNLDDFRVQPQLIDELRKNGTINAMVNAGVKPGNTIRIGDWEFEWEYEV